MNKIINALIYPGPLLKYLYFSGGVTLLDAFISWFLYRPLNFDLIISNTTGVVIGFLVHYLLSSKNIFDAEYGIAGFMIYLSTFILSLILATAIIYSSDKFLFGNLQKDLGFLLSKGLSIVIPFFFQYYTRRLLFSGLAKKANN